MEWFLSPCRIPLSRDFLLRLVKFTSERLDPGRPEFNRQLVCAAVEVDTVDEQLDDINTRLGEAVLADGRFLVGTSKIGARSVFRPAFSNWRTRFSDVEEFAEVVLEVADSLT